MTNANTYTNLTALQASLELASNAGMVDLANKLQTMVNTEAKKRAAAKNAPKTPTKEQRENLNLAQQMIKAIVDNGNTPVGTKWISEHVPFLTTHNQVSGKARIAKANGWIEYAPRTGKEVMYQASPEGVAMVAGLAA